MKFISKYAKFADIEHDYDTTNTISANTSFDGSMRTRTIMSKMDENDQADMPF